MRALKHLDRFAFLYWTGLAGTPDNGRALNRGAPRSWGLAAPFRFWPRSRRAAPPAHGRLSLVKTSFPP